MILIFFQYIVQRLHFLPVLLLRRQLRGLDGVHVAVWIGLGATHVTCTLHALVPTHLRGNVCCPAVFGSVVRQTFFHYFYRRFCSSLTTTPSSRLEETSWCSPSWPTAKRNVHRNWSPCEENYLSVALHPWEHVIFPRHTWSSYRVFYRIICPNGTRQLVFPCGPVPRPRPRTSTSYVRNNQPRKI